MSTRLPQPATPSAILDDGAPVFTADVAVIGAGVAGLAFAASLLDRRPQARVLVIDKGDPGRSGSSPWAQGGVAVALGPDDSPQLHAADTVAAGDGLVDPVAAEVLARDGPAAITRLVQRGARFDTSPDGSLHLAREGGQSVARSVHRADATGAEMVRALRAALSDRVRRIAGPVLALRRSDGRVDGLWVLVEDSVGYVDTPAVVLATGGCGGLFASTTNQPGATGDGIALAWNAGAALRDLEFVQFHPTGLAHGDDDGGGARLLLTEALRGAGATLHDADGSRFLTAVHPDAELAPRHVVTRAITLLPGRTAWLDATRIGRSRLEEEFPTALNGAREGGYDLATQRVPVSPVAHYHVGGVRTDLGGRTSLPGLWAVGEVASTGVHGANRMAGNSLLEALVFAGRAADAVDAADTAPRERAHRAPQLEGARPSPVAIVDLRRELRARMWAGCGPVRDATSLAEAARGIAEIARQVGPPSADPRHVELVHAVTAAGLIVRAASARTESRGGHVRDDHQARDPAWDGVHLEWLQPAEG